MRIFIFILIYVVVLFSQDFSLNFDGDDDYVVINNSFLDSDEDPLTFVFKISLNNIENEELFGGSLFGQFTNSWCGYNNFVKINHSALTFDHYGPSGGGIDISHNFYSSLKKEYTLYLTKDSDSLHLYVNDGIFTSYYGSAYHPENYNESFSTTPVIGSRRCEWVDEWRDEFSGKIDELIVIQKTYSLDQIINQQYLLDENYYLAFYDFNSGQGNILYDISGNDNHGTIYGATWIENIYGCTDELAENFNLDANWDDSSCTYPDNGDFSLSFDGVDDWVDIPSFDLDYPLTIEVSIKAPFQEGTIIGRGPDEPIYNETSYVITVGPQSPNPGLNGQIRWHIGTDGICGYNGGGWNFDDSNIEINEEQWNNITTTYDGDDASIYLDGVNVNTFSHCGNINQNNNNITIGKMYEDYHFNGQIDEIRIWSRIISQSEFNNFNEENQDNLLANYKFNSGSGDILYDHSGNQNHGTIFGASWTENSINQCCFESYGDVNCDTILDISDIIIIIDMILDLINITYDQNDCADINADGIIDISDLILLIDSILGF